MNMFMPRTEKKKTRCQGACACTIYMKKFSVVHTEYCFSRCRQKQAIGVHQNYSSESRSLLRYDTVSPLFTQVRSAVINTNKLFAVEENVPSSLSLPIRHKWRVIVVVVRQYLLQPNGFYCH